MYICVCKGITDSQIRATVNGGAESIKEVRAQLGVSSQCGNCASEVRDIVEATLAKNPASRLFYDVA